MSTLSAFFHVLLVSLIYLHPLSANPVRRADLPDVSVNKWRNTIDKGRFAGKQCVFYAVGLTQEARRYVGLPENRDNKISIWDTYNEAQYMNFGVDPLQAWKSVDRQIEYFQHQSQVFAENCVGDILVMIADGAPDEPKKSIWTDTEFATIRGELLGAAPSQITKVTRIDKSGVVQKVLWTSAGAPSIRNKSLRILAVGDSITYGTGADPPNSYRKRLLDSLTADGNTVNYIGSQSSGDFSENKHEGYPGRKIADISGLIGPSLSQRPNVVLIHAGTNDMGSIADAAGANDRLGSLVDKVIAACPDAAVLVSRIIRRKSTKIDDPTFNYANDIYDVVQGRQNAGKHVWLVDHYTSIQPFDQPGPNDLSDDLHPNAGGYTKMGDIWKLSLQQVSQKGWINTPVAGTGTGGPTKDPCNGKLFWVPFGQLANGAGLGKDFYAGRKCTDYVMDAAQCTCQPFDNSITNVQKKPASGKCSDLNQANHHAVTFADLNADGRMDYIWIGAGGELTAFLNGGKAADGHWIWYPQPAKIATGVGGTRDQIRIADINDLWVHPNGAVDVWINQKTTSETGTTFGINWNPQTRSATGIGIDGGGIMFADLNNDGRVEYIGVDGTGGITVYLNGGGKDNLSRPHGPNAGVINWIPQDSTPLTISGSRNRTAFADINGDGRLDYLAVSRTNGAVQEQANAASRDTGPNAGVITWVSKGTIATGVGTSGVSLTFGDITGDGRYEYLDVDPNTSAVNMWLNGCDTS